MRDNEPLQMHVSPINLFIKFIEAFELKTYDA